MRNSLGLAIGFLLVLTGCKQSTESLTYKSRVTPITIASTTLNRAVAGNLYQPLINNKIAENAPVIFLLHGHGGDHHDWFQEQEGNVQAILDSLIANKQIPPVHALSMNAGNSWYVDSQENMEQFYKNEVFPYIASINTPQNPNLVDLNMQLIAGNSAGGYGSLRFALIEPERFKAVLLLSPAAYDPLPPAISSSRKIPVFAKDSLFNDSIWKAYNYKHHLGNLKVSTSTPKFYISTGTEDAYNITPVVKTIQYRLDSLEQKTAVSLIPGGHDWQVWRTNFANNLVDFFNE